MADQSQMLNNINRALKTLSDRVESLNKVKTIELNLKLGKSYQSLEEFTSKVRETAQLLRELGKEDAPVNAAKAAKKEFEALRNITAEIANNIKLSADYTVNLAKQAVSAQNQILGVQQAVSVSKSQAAAPTGGPAGGTDDIIERNKKLAGAADEVNKVLRNQQREFERGIHSAKSWADFIRIVRSTQENLAASTSNVTMGFRDFIKIAVQAQQAGLSPQKSVFAQLASVVNGLTGNMMNLIYWQARWYATKNLIFGTVAAFKDGVKTFIEFDQQLQNIKSISNATNTEMQSLSKTMLEVAKNTKFGLMDISKATAVLAQTGFSINQINEALPAAAILATAALTDLNTTVQLITSSVSIFGLELEEISSVADIFANAVDNTKLTIEGISTSFNYVGPIAAQLGMDMAETAAAMGLLANKGTQASTIGTSLRTLFGALVSPTDKLRKALERVGLTVSDVNPRIQGFEKVLENLQRANLDVEEIFSGLDRRAASALTSLLQEGASGFIRLRDSMEQSGSAARKAQTQLLGFQQTLEVLRQNIQIFFTTVVERSLFGQKLLGFFDNLKERLITTNKAFAAGLYTGIEEQFKELGSKLENVAIALAAIFAAKFAYSLVRSLIGALSTTLGPLLGAALPAAFTNPAVGAAITLVAVTLAALFGSTFTNKAIDTMKEVSEGKAREFAKLAGEQQTQQVRLNKLANDIKIIREQEAKNIITASEAQSQFNALITENKTLLEDAEKSTKALSVANFSNFNMLVSSSGQFVINLENAAKILEDKIKANLFSEKIARFTTPAEQIERTSVLKNRMSGKTLDTGVFKSANKVIADTNIELKKLTGSSDNAYEAVRKVVGLLNNLKVNKNIVDSLANVQDALGEQFESKDYEVVVRLIDKDGNEVKRASFFEEQLSLSPSQKQQLLDNFLGGNWELALDVTLNPITKISLGNLSPEDQIRLQELVKDTTAMMQTALNSEVVTVDIIDQIRFAKNPELLRLKALEQISGIYSALRDAIYKTEKNTALRDILLQNLENTFKSGTEFKPELVDQMVSNTSGRLGTSIVADLKTQTERVSASIKALILEFENTIPKLTIPEGFLAAFKFEGDLNSLIAANEEAAKELNERKTTLTEALNKPNIDPQLAENLRSQLAKTTTELNDSEEKIKRYKTLTKELKDGLAGFTGFQRELNSAFERMSKFQGQNTAAAIKTGEQIQNFLRDTNTLLGNSTNTAEQRIAGLKKIFAEYGAILEVIPPEIKSSLERLAANGTDGLTEVADTLNLVQEAATIAIASLRGFSDTEQFINKQVELFNKLIGVTDKGSTTITNFSDMWSTSNRRLQRELENLRFSDQLTQSITKYTTAVSLGIATTEQFQSAIVGVTSETYDVSLQLRINEKTVRDTTNSIQILEQLVENRRSEIEQTLKGTTDAANATYEGMDARQKEAHDASIKRIQDRLEADDEVLKKLKDQLSALKAAKIVGDEKSAQLEEQIRQLEEQTKQVLKIRDAYLQSADSLEARVGTYQALIIRQENSLALIEQEIELMRELNMVQAERSLFTSAIPDTRMDTKGLAESPLQISPETIENISNLNLKIKELSNLTPKIKFESFLTSEQYAKIVNTREELQNIYAEQQKNLINEELLTKRINNDLNEQTRLTRTINELTQIPFKDLNTGEQQELLNAQTQLEILDKRIDKNQEEKDKITQRNRELEQEIKLRQKLVELMEAQDTWANGVTQGIKRYIDSIKNLGDTIADVMNQVLKGIEDTFVKMTVDNVLAVEEFNEALKAERDAQRAEQQAQYTQDVQDLQMKLMLQEIDQQRYHEAIVRMNADAAQKRHQTEQDYENKKKSLWDETKETFRSFLSDLGKMLMKEAAKMIIQWLLVAAARALATGGEVPGNAGIEGAGSRFAINMPNAKAEGGIIKAASGGQIINNYYQNMKRYGTGGLDVAEGGKLRGGTPNKDSIHALVMPGEYVVRKSAVENYGADFFHRLNSERIDPRKLPRYAEGGVVGPNSGSSSNESSSNNAEMKTTQVVIYNVVDPNSIPKQPTADDIINIISLDTTRNGKSIQTIRERIRG